MELGSEPGLTDYGARTLNLSEHCPRFKLLWSLRPRHKLGALALNSGSLLLRCELWSAGGAVGEEMRGVQPALESSVTKLRNPFYAGT